MSESKARSQGGSLNWTHDWARDIFETFGRQNIRQVAYVPDAGHADLIVACRQSPEIVTTSLTTEEEGIPLLAGAWLGGQRGALLMQSSGVGNCINMLSLADNGRFPLVMLVTMRGEWGEFNPWQVPMSKATQTVLEAMGVVVYRVDRPEQVRETVDAAIAFSYDSDVATAVLLSQQLIGRKTF
jgi:sulfopyruvate decarboxylase alpha subunit